MIAQSKADVYEEVKDINGKLFADLWLEGKASPYARPEWPWMVLTLKHGHHHALWFDTEDTATDYVNAHQDYKPFYIARIVSVRSNVSKLVWENYT